MSLALQLRYLALRLAIITGFVASFWLSLPAPVRASEPVSSGTGGGYFATPYMLRGQFVFINRVSRRTLLRSFVKKAPVEDIAIREYL